ncbi:hypothetical protein DPEC_G00263250 [Dallia pectoralis]|uniref:Uncharacterized protein n=1 Tax=Dallia pectoralis TaxID=75939 RepID=A0ACC2FS40_DALPE|nr:hypothetical protein DPEC_G00263250 [Dallia pectoralis]
MAEESAVKVCVRVRRLIEREETAAGVGENEPVKLHWEADKLTIHQIDDGNLSKNFSFDRVFSAEETTQQLYQELAKPLVVSTVEGYNGTIFAYGQTSSGKTFTMMGSSLNPGVIPLAMEDVFQTIKNCPKKEFLLRVSYLEIYNETVTDLLCDSWKRKPLEIREGNNKTVYVADLSEELVTSPEQALSWIKKGEKNRHYGKTKMNQRSSRSHTIFRMILESRDRGDTSSGENSDGAIFVSHLNLVDLAGTERASQTGAEGTRFKEGCNINRSLFTLGQVIKKLSDETQKGFTNYRDSKLTRILQNSLGGNAKTVIICTITPVTVEETLSTLQFASAAKNMKNDPHVTEVSDDGALLRRYRNEIVDLKRRLNEVSSVTQTTATEKETLSQILQEKDQLQREQEDRIKNLTKLLVTSSNFVPIKKMPKRRVTWGGKLPLAAFHHEGETDRSFAEPFIKKRKADMSVLTEQNEDAEEFDLTLDVERSGRFSESEFLSPNQPETQMEDEAQQAMEKVETLERRVAELEQELQQKTVMSTSAQNQMKEGFEETIQLCETLVSEKEMIAAERDFLNQELTNLTEQTTNLKKEKADLLQEIEEKKDMEEFNSLEEESKREYEKELLAEMSSLKRASDASERKCQELEVNLLALSEELRKKGELAEELQKSSDVDLVLQVKQLRRSLDDAVCLSQDTKKDWAHLRSENISLKERDVSLTAGYERMEAEVNSLCSQLEKEKSSFKKMQIDLQRELHGAFEENTKLTALLDGKVPKSLIDSLELEKTVACLKKELENSQEVERSLHVKIEALSALEHLPAKVDSLLEQLKEKEDHQETVENNLCRMQQVITDLEEKLAVSESSKKSDDTQFLEHQDQLRLLNEELESVKAERERLLSERTDIPQDHADELEKLLSTVTSLTEERDQLQEILQVVREEKNQLKRDLEENVEMQQRLNSELQPHGEHQESDLSLQIQLDTIKDLKEQLEAVKEERSQLKTDIHENVEMMIENQEELRQAQEKVRTLREKNQQLTSQNAELETRLNMNASDNASSLRELQEQIIQASVRAEKESLLSVNSDSPQYHTGELEKLLSTVTSLTDERDQLQEILPGVREEKDQLKRDLEENVEMMIHIQGELKQQQHLYSEQQTERACQEDTLQRNIQQLGEELENLRDERNQLKGDLQINVEMAAERQELLHSIQEELQQQKNIISDLEAQSLQKESLLEQQVNQLREELESVRAEKEKRLSSQTGCALTPAEDFKKLLSTVTSLTDERDQLQEILLGVREEKNQLKRDLEENVEMMICVQAELKQQQHVQSEQQMERELQEATLQQKIQQLKEKLETVTQERCQIDSDLQKNVEMAAERQELLHTIQEELQLQKNLNVDLEAQSLQESSLKQQVYQLSEEIESVRAERERLLSERTDIPQSHADELEKLLSTVTSLTEERDQLQEILQGLREEKDQLKRGLEENLDMMICVQAELKQQQHVQSEQQMERELQEATLQQKIQQLEEKLETMTQERCQIDSDLQKNVEMAAERQELLHTIQEELQLQKNLNVDLEAQSLQESSLKQQVNRLSEEIESVRAERERLLSERTDIPQSHADELEKLLSTVTSLTDERDQLQEILQGLREEKNQLKRDLEENVEMTAERQELLYSIQEELQQQKNIISDLEAQSLHKESLLEQQANQLREELESVRAEKEHILFEKTAVSQIPAEDFKKLLSTVTSLTDERDQLQEILLGVSEEKNQLKRDLEENVEMMICVHAELKQQQHVQSEQQMEMELQEATLQQKIQQLKEKLETVTQERCQIDSDLQKNVEMAAERQELLHTIQEELQLQKNLNLDLEAQSLQESSLKQQLREELESVKVEREHLLSERTDIRQNHADELEKLLSTVTSLTEERDQLQKILQELRDEKNQLKRDLEENVEMMKLLEAELAHLKHEQCHKEDVETSCMMLTGVNATDVLTAPVNIQGKRPSFGTTRATEGLRFKLEASAEHIQECFVRFQLVIDGVSKPEHELLGDVSQVEEAMIFNLLPHLPKVSRRTSSNINRWTVQINETVWDVKVLLKLCAENCKTHFEALLKNDLAVFEERRLQDLLLCRAPAPSHSMTVADEDLLGVWDQRLLELLTKRGDYLQKIKSVLKKLEEGLATHRTTVSDELGARLGSNEELNALTVVHSVDSAIVERFLEQELVRCSDVAQAALLSLQGLRTEQHGLQEELDAVRARSDNLLNEERTKTFTLLQIVESAPIKNEVILLRDNRQLFPHRQLDGELKEMHARIEELEEDKIKAAHTVSNHKRATQLLQTELQDVCAKVVDVEGSIKILEEKLRNAETMANRRVSPSALELGDLKAKVVKMELEMTSLSSKHQEELLRLNAVLKHKEDALRTLKETLRKSQQEGEQSFMEGEDLHARLIANRGRKVQSNILMEKDKLDEEVKDLQKKVSELESLVSSQQGELAKWKARAIKLKKRDAGDKPLSPCTPKKRGVPLNSEDLNSPKRFLHSPKRFLDSPRKLLDSPKSKFFDVHPGSEAVSIACPKQFFDNSTFETTQDADKKEDWCPLSPKQADVCHQQ